MFSFTLLSLVVKVRFKLDLKGRRRIKSSHSLDIPFQVSLNNWKVKNCTDVKDGVSFNNTSNYTVCYHITYLLVLFYIF